MTANAILNLTEVSDMAGDNPTIRDSRSTENQWQAVLARDAES